MGLLAHGRAQLSMNISDLRHYADFAGVRNGGALALAAQGHSGPRAR